MFRIVYGGSTILTFEAHSVGTESIVMPAMGRAPAIPVHAAVFCDCEDGDRLVGFVANVKPAKMQRWEIVLDGAYPQKLAEAANKKKEAHAAAAAVEAEFPAEVHGLETLRPLLTSRTFSAIQSVTTSVEALASMTDEALLAIDGVGSRTLESIRDACAKVMNG